MVQCDWMREDNPHGIVGLKGSNKENKDGHRQTCDLRFLACEWQQSVLAKVCSRSHPPPLNSATHTALATYGSSALLSAPAGVNGVGGWVGMNKAVAIHTLTRKPTKNNKAFGPLAQSEHAQAAIKTAAKLSHESRPKNPQISLENLAVDCAKCLSNTMPTARTNMRPLGVT